MKNNTIQALSLALALSSPFAMSLTAVAQEQVTRPAEVQQVAQNNDEIRTFGFSEYGYWDARVLAEFWGTSVLEAKARIGRKIGFGVENKAYLRQMLLDARLKALGRVDDLKLYVDSGFGYEDAAALATFWGDASPWESKLRIERNLIMGDDEVIREALRMARQQDDPGC